MAEVMAADVAMGGINTREYARSPTSISPVSSRRSSLKPDHPGKSPETTTSTSPPVRLTRKRVASLNADIANQDGMEKLALSAPVSAPITSGDRVCLCQPDPKIPRPRNGVCETFHSLSLITWPLARALLSFVLAPTLDWSKAYTNSFIAFILYRQHYQLQVVAQNPGLANPEISKIIGEQWRDQPIEVKNEWKRLAEVPLYLSRDLNL